MSPAILNKTAKHPGGRPTKYLPEYCERIVSFFLAGGPDFARPMVVSDGKVGSHIEDHPLGKLPATFESFAHSIGVHVDTLNEWQSVHPEFSEAYKKAKQIQLDQICKGLLSQSYSAAGAIFMLKNCHGWRDRSEIEHSGEIKTGPLVFLPETRMNGHANGHAAESLRR